MALIRIHKDPLRGEFTEHKTTGEVNLLEWLMEFAPWLGEQHVMVRLNNQTLGNTKEDLDLEDKCDIQVGLFDQVDVVVLPAEPASIIYAVVVAVVAIGVALLLPIPKIPNDAGKVSTSPNNQLNAATNQFRNGQAQPNILGQVISYPDFIQPSYYRYENNMKQVYELFEVGEGHHEIELQRIGTQLISDTPSFSTNTYPPGTTPSKLLDVRGTNEVDGQEIYPPDSANNLWQIQSGASSGVYFDFGGPAVTELGMQVGDSLQFSYQYEDPLDNMLKYHNGHAQIVAINSTSLVELDISQPMSEPGSIYGTVKNLSNLASSPWFVLDGDRIEEIWFQVVAPSGVRDENGDFLSIEFRIEAFEIDANGDEVGSLISETRFLNNNSLEPLFRTWDLVGLKPSRYKARIRRITNEAPDGSSDLVKIEDIQSVTYYGEYPQVWVDAIFNATSITSMTQAEVDDLDVAVGDRIQIQIPNLQINEVRTVSSVTSSSIGWTQSIAGALNNQQQIRISNLSKKSHDFGFVTLVDLSRRATTLATSARQDKFNVQATRKLELFDPNTGTFDDGNFTATRSFAQAAMYILHKQGKVPLSRINYQQLFAIEQSLSDPQLGYFDFTFDDRNVGMDERLVACCNAARVKVYQSGNIYNFTREESKPARKALFNRRNIVPAASEQTIKWQRSREFDSIRLKYVDPATNSEAYVERRINPTTKAIESGIGDYPKDIELAGCRNALQAINRCELEIRKLKYLRTVLKETVLGDGLMVGGGDRVGWEDINDSEIFSGEILGFEGTTEFLTSEPFKPKPGVDYYVYLTGEDGTPTNSVLCQPHPDTEFGFVATGLVAYVADGYTAQVGSRYFIASESDMDAYDFTITERGEPDEFNRVTIQAVNYDERCFEKD